MPDVDRRAEIAAGLAAVEDRVAKACAAAGRDRAELTVVVVTKTFPADDVRLLAELGVRDVGENRDQEAAGKAAECADLGLVWHFVGRLQSNKARSVTAYADLVHSVDRVRLVTPLERGAAAHEREVTCLVQVDLRPDAERDDARGGVGQDEVLTVADAVASAQHLALGGVMAVAPQDADPREAFARLAKVAAELRAAHPTATVISAGMSGDLEAAVASGATHLRVGTAILGSRPPLG